jgi:transglutaminase-like putative cysteine protease
VPFLSALSRRIAERCRPAIRLQGDPQPPAFTLREGTGACRDLSVLFIDACRAVGLAARFVSGYYGGPSAADRRYLHAWAEVFLPGAGWRGFDPLQGLAVADRHVAVAAGAQPRDAAPITGTLGGGDTPADLEVDLKIESTEAASHCRTSGSR